ncbi:carboxypeptidase-like regulatory domain-containing protein [Gemmata sp. JC717]|uniref:carboxypeptidase-like regulatory domain-containing protein n=1 Tax=Gemmata algarum TaxID=2975278 RepID=UPI0021BB9618|nr:carboxypeptidase-like regulatory domain-containing protein [Gemmata algarum]MDY3555717.1 carboxypeptidase-like regulatory domain-containing protein [Gemmata algarum]
MNRYRLLALLCATAYLVGCSGSKEVPRGPVKGRVTLSGKPLAGATIVFENKALGVAQSTTLDDDGKYEFMTYAAAGLPAGSYKVTISSGRFMQPGEEIPKFGPGTKVGATPPPKKAPTSIPDKYAKIESSGLSADVKAGDNQPFDFDLKP